MDGDMGEQHKIGDSVASQAASRGMAQHNSPRPPSPAPSLSARFAPPPRSRWRAIVSGVSILVVIAVVGVVVANILGMGRVHSSPPKTAIRLNLASSGLTCVSQVAWSPDSTRIAVVGSTESGCGGSVSSHPSTLVTIYDAHSGKLLSKLNPDTTILAAPEVKTFLNSSANSEHAPGLTNYTSCTWTPDGQSLLILFSVGLSLQEGQGPQSGDPNSPTPVDGLLRLHVSGSAPTTLWVEKAGPYVDSQSTLRWDTVKGVAEFVPMPAAASSYSWNSDGSLTPFTAVVDGAVGQPDGGTFFTIWQSGQMRTGDSFDRQSGQMTNVPQDIIWNPQFVAVSPDGRYLYPFITGMANLVPPSTKQVQTWMPSFQPHDQAQLALATQMTQATPKVNTIPSGVELSWRADGHVMAHIVWQMQALPNGSSTETTTILLYDTASGKLIQQLAPDLSGLQSRVSSNPTLLWSPDGSRLLYIDNIYGGATIWGPGALPK